MFRQEGGSEDWLTTACMACSWPVAWATAPLDPLLALCCSSRTRFAIYGPDSMCRTVHSHVFHSKGTAFMEVLR